MKKLLLPFICSFSILATAQNNLNITSQQYDLMKKNRQLDVTKKYIITDAPAPVGTPIHYRRKQLSEKSQSSICSCLVPLDTSFHVCEFAGSGGNGGPGTAPDYRNDDWSTPLKSLPFNFNFYGTIYNSIYINNNGNVSFSSPYSTFTANPFPDPSFEMIAPFWADVDTRGAGSGLVYYKITPTHVIIKWDSVGYYDSYFDKLNTFQLILTDGNDSILPSGNNVAFCYGEMEWTSGDASGGTNGFGGTSATVGVNKGDGINYFQVGTFDSTGVSFDGPYGNPDGVNWLSNQGMYFNVSSSVNIPPVIINNNICDTIDVYTGDTTHTMIIDSVRFSIGVTTPEPNQIVTANISSPDTSHLSYTLGADSLYYKQYKCSFSVKGLAQGLHYVNITAKDNGTIEGQTTSTVVIRSHFDSSFPSGINQLSIENSEISIFPNPFTSQTIITFSSEQKKTTIKILDVLGKEIRSETFSGKQFMIEKENMNSGIYFVQITDEKKNIVNRKIVVE